MVGEEPVPVVPEVPSTLSTPSILIVDDDEPVLITLRGILEVDGYHVTATTSGQEALDLIRTEHFDVVLTDLRLDGIDGDQLLQELKSRDSGDTASIVLTGYASMDSAIRALREGAYDYLLKPCDVLEIRTTVARAIDRTWLSRQLQQRMRDLEQANETIRALNLELEARVDEATEELREQIVARDEFMSTVSHDLKSPLTFIKGMASLRRRRATPSPENKALLDALEQIEASAGRMAQQLDELADASRLQAGVPLELRRERIDLVELARNAVAQHQQTTDRHALRLLSSVPDLFGVWDRLRLGRVLDNLLDNAVKFSPRGGSVEVCVATEGDQAVLSISDNGEGIPPADVPHIFERFHRARNVEGRIPGTGIGLVGVRNIIGLHQGTITVDSKVGTGTTFTIRLPVGTPTTA